MHSAPLAGRYWPPATTSTTSSPMALHARHLTKTFGVDAHAVHALRGVDLAVPQGSFLALMGPSGSGKSTLLQCLSGLETPDDGVITVAGTNVLGMDEERRTVLRRDVIGLVFQHYNLIPYLTAEQNVALPLELAGSPDPAAVTAALESVALSDRAGHLPRELSGGQQQRVAIARALVGDPVVILADEPTGALDRTSAQRVLSLLRQIVDGQGRTIVMVTHDPVAASYADTVVFLVDGQIAGHSRAPGIAEIAATMAHLDDQVDGRTEVAS